MTFAEFIHEYKKAFKRGRAQCLCMMQGFDEGRSLFEPTEILEYEDDPITIAFIRGWNKTVKENS